MGCALPLVLPSPLPQALTLCCHELLLAGPRNLGTLGENSSQDRELSSQTHPPVPQARAPALSLSPVWPLCLRLWGHTRCLWPVPGLQVSDTHPHRLCFIHPLNISAPCPSPFPLQGQEGLPHLPQEGLPLLPVLPWPSPQEWGLGLLPPSLRCSGPLSRALLSSPRPLLVPTPLWPQA